MKNFGYLSALAALADSPILVKTLFTRASQSLNPNGVYDLIMYKNGYPIVIRVDDFIPCEPGEGNGPKFAHCKNNQSLWVLLVEKALAKLHGSYKALQNCSIAGLLTDLTGAPCKQLTVYGAHLRPKVSVLSTLNAYFITDPFST